MSNGSTLRMLAEEVKAAIDKTRDDLDLALAAESDNGIAGSLVGAQREVKEALALIDAALVIQAGRRT